MKDLSIIIVSYNTKDLTVDCIKSILKFTKGIRYEIIVADNASTDGSVEAIEKLVGVTHSAKASQGEKTIILIKNSQNLGFARANNLAIKKVNGKYILLLNSDTLLTSNILTPILTWMENHAKVGIFSCGLKNKDGSIQATGGYFPTLGRVINWMFFIDDIPFISNFFSSYHPKKAFYKRQHLLDWVTGAFFLTRKELWDDVGAFDEKYYMYVEEVDFCFRAKEQGWQVFYDPDFSLIHYGGASSKSVYPIVSEYKGLKIFYRKHFAGWQSLQLRIILKIGAFARIVILGFFKGSEYAKIYEEAYLVA